MCFTVVSPEIFICLFWYVVKAKTPDYFDIINQVQKHAFSPEMKH